LQIKRLSTRLLPILVVGNICVCLSAQPGSTTDTANNEVKTIAVMNFDNRNPGEWQWLGKGLADMMITDLSASETLIVVERERLNDITAELQLIKTGMIDTSIADQVGHIAKVDWVLFGSFLKNGDHLKIEAHIFDMKTQGLLRVEWVEGLAEKVMELEKRLIQQLLERLHVPVTEEERRSILYVPTDSVSALEHYCRSLDLYDNGQWYEAFLECRLAVRQDTGYISARSRVAELYYEIGKPEHALVEYQDLVKADKDNTYPEHIYYKMGQLLEDKFKDSPSAVLVYKKIVNRHPELEWVFDREGKPRIDPPIVTITGTNPRYCLGALERIAAYRESTNNKLEAAKHYWQICTIMLKGDLRKGVLGDLQNRCRIRFDTLYRQLIQENQNAIFAPSYPYFYNYPLVVMWGVPETGGKFPETSFMPYYVYPTSEIQKQIRLLAPCDKEFAEITVSVDTDIANPSNSDPVQIDCKPIIRKPFETKVLKLRTGVQTASFQLDPGNRVVELCIFGKETFPEIEIKLREWVGLTGDVPKPIAKGRLQVRFSPDLPSKICFYNAQHQLLSTRTPSRGGFDSDRTPGKYFVEVYWKDGSSQMTEYEIKPGGVTSLFLHNGQKVISHTNIADQGCFTNLYTDHQGTIWLLWDQAGVRPGRRDPPSGSSDIYCATSPDGVSWSQPRKLPISSSELDMKPSLQQDPQGLYWLIWCSSRDADSPQSLWMASSSDGVKWSFPNKVPIQFTTFFDNKKLEDLIENHYAYSIDREGQFQISWLAHYYTSSDGRTWHEDSLPFRDPKPVNNLLFNPESMTHDDTNQLMFLQIRSKQLDQKRNITTRILWHQQENQDWINLGDMGEDDILNASLAAGRGRCVVAYSSLEGIFVKEYKRTKGWSNRSQIESYLKNPVYPSVTVLPNGNASIAYSCKDGVVVKLIKSDNQ
jgi:TolB-like protein